jgi:chromate transporter|eukprot:TRINITY_DN21932_c0_g1_i1.p1 TRINITY_DN21932_c0_g1~~TRINITY_DN21932_c0_g1_i1.p1  ORF type:complete len:444 (-),score=69.64 TRINITY_DN21932_c0_g1_i1:196-1467(-)
MSENKEALLPSDEGASLGELAWQFFVLGTTAFGGPAVHFGMFQARFVEKFQWMSSERYTELMAMSNCLPGPSSTQTAFAIGISQRGVVGGLVAGLMFLIPGAIGMTVLGFLSSHIREEVEEPKSVANAVASACSAVGVALVFVAVTQLVGKNAQSPLRAVICFGSAAATLVVQPSPAWMNPALIFFGGLVSMIFPVSHAANTNESKPAGKTGLSAMAGAVIFGLYILLAAFTIYDSAVDRGWLIPFLTAGMFVWGGGPVVLPMLMTVLTPTWISHSIFLTGIALAEMMPGPVFNLSCFIGVQLALANNFNWFLGTFLCWAGLVGPGVVLTFGAMPLWDKLRQFEAYHRALPGLNAAAVGLLVATLFSVYSALEVKSPFPAGSRAVALCAFAAINSLKLSVPIVVVVAGAVGFVWSMCGCPGGP